MKKVLLLFLILVTYSLYQYLRYDDALDPDLTLSKIVATYNIGPLPVRHFEVDQKYTLGQALFYDPILSGNRDIACATCHLWNRSTTDSIPLAVGTLGTRLAENRELNVKMNKVGRHSSDLWNRDNNSVNALFWDGRVEMVDPVKRIFRTPLGKSLPEGLDNTLAVQALFPLLRQDEMLGRAEDRSPDTLPPPHANRRNEFVSDIEPNEGRKRGRSNVIFSRILERLLGQKEKGDEPWQSLYRELFSAAYPGKSIGQFNITDVANALAHYEELAFATRNTTWDKYLSGDRNAISLKAKKGAILFFGKARCSVCHNGPLLSDFDYHSLGLSEKTDIGTKTIEDFGRFNVTKLDEDKYKFRTPPLRNTTKTAPYFHNGSAKTLRQAIDRHLNPLKFADKYNDDGSFTMSRRQIESVSKVLSGGIQLSEMEISNLVGFLESLNDSPPIDLMDKIIPKSVPSGLPVPWVEPYQH